MNRIFLLALIGCLIASCTGTKEASDLIIADMEFRDLDTMVIAAPSITLEERYQLPDYQESYQRKNDLLHTSLDLRFDWQKQQVIGQATLKLKPYFYPTETLVLDAKGFDIKQVALLKNGQTTDLQYEYDQLNLTIQLDRQYTAEESYSLFIDYIAKPNELEANLPKGAFNGEKGLYFINPLKEDTKKPMQIWTQGETEYNSCWFPTIDKPNERCTQEMRLTVQDRFKTLSNGLLKSSNKNADGTRTDYWVMDQPHAPYLFMLTIGEFAVAKERWENIELEYWVEPEYETTAKAIYSNTPEMLTFFSEITGVKYPWQKYTQVVVRDFVAGAMENTTGVIFYDQVQKKQRELIDNHNERIVAHELVHHWFGDLVTCESWSNLAMNESFANYGEYLWLEHKYGKAAAEYHRLNELGGYLRQAATFKHPLIFFEFEDKEDMFDAHSYNKGGAILHMLRNYVGDDAFLAALNLYLTKNEYTDVEAHELRLAFEDVTGEDLNWFFNQWFFEAGHPTLEFSHTYDELRNEVSVTIEQTQNPEENVAVYELPMDIDIHYGSSIKRQNITLTQRKQTFKFSVPAAPKLINIDADKMLLCEKKELSKTEEQYAYLYKIGNFMDRYEALDALSKSKSDLAQQTLQSAMSDPFWALRRMAINRLDASKITSDLARLAQDDERSQVREIALRKLGETNDKTFIPIAKNALDNEQPYPCVAAGLDALYQLSPTEAISYASKLESETNASIIATIGQIYGASGDVQYLSFFEEKLSENDDFSIFNLMDDYDKLIAQADGTTIDASFAKLKNIATDMSQWQWRRLVSTRSIKNYRDFLAEGLEKVATEQKPALQARINSIEAILNEIKSKETSPRIQGFYERM